MDAEVKAKWIEALRSGKYKQGKQRLRTGDGSFCCLGVLCEIEGAEWHERDDEHEWDAIIDGARDWGELPAPLRRRLDIALDVANYVANMNDRGKSFDVIADYIEEHL